MSLDNIDELLKINTFIKRKHTREDRMDFHFHNSWEILYIKKGNLKIIYKDKKEKIRELNAFNNRIILVPSNVVHRLEFLNDVEIMVLEIEDFNKSYIRYLKSMYGFRNDKTIKELTSSSVFPTIFKDVDNIEGKMNSLIKLEKDHNSNVNNEIYNLEHKLLLKDLLFAIYFSYKNMPIKKNNTYINNCITYIYDHICDELTISKIASEIDISEVYLKKLFKNVVGMTLHKYINKIKIEQAVEYFKTTSLNGNDVAVKSGFKNYNILYKCFVRELGKTPKEIKDELKIKPIQYFNREFKAIV